MAVIQTDCELLIAKCELKDLGICNLKSEIRGFAPAFAGAASRRQVEAFPASPPRFI